MSKILLVEDNSEIMNMNATTLSMYGYEVLCAESLKQADELLAANEPDMIVLDIMLPDGNGLAWCKRLKEYRSIPLLFLSALNENADIVAGLRAGGDDYLPKPYDLEVFLARVEARLQAAQSDSRFISFGELKLDIYTDTAAYKDKNLLLSQKEFFVLHTILLNSKKAKAVSKEELLEKVWGLSTGKDASTLYTAISRLNSKLFACDSNLTVSFMKPDGYTLEQC